MTPLLPSPLTQSMTAPIAQTQVSRVDRVDVAVYEDGRGRTQTQSSAEWRERLRTSTVPPPERDGAGERDPRRTHARDYPLHWPTAPFFTQQLSQEALPDTGPPLSHLAGAMRYPTLALDSDIILPGDGDLSVVAPSRRVDMVV